MVEDVLLTYKDDIRDFAYVSGELRNTQTPSASSKVSDYSRLEASNTAVQAVQPSALLDDSFQVYHSDVSSALSYTE